MLKYLTPSAHNCCYANNEIILCFVQAIYPYKKLLLLSLPNIAYKLTVRFKFLCHCSLLNQIRQIGEQLHITTFYSPKIKKLNKSNVGNLHKNSHLIMAFFSSSLAL